MASRASRMERRGGVVVEVHQLHGGLYSRGLNAPNFRPHCRRAARRLARLRRARRRRGREADRKERKDQPRQRPSCRRSTAPGSRRSSPSPTRSGPRSWRSRRTTSATPSSSASGRRATIQRHGAQRVQATAGTSASPTRARSSARPTTPAASSCSLNGPPAARSPPTLHAAPLAARGLVLRGSDPIGHGVLRRLLPALGRRPVPVWDPFEGIDALFVERRATDRATIAAIRDGCMRRRRARRRASPGWRAAGARLRHPALAHRGEARGAERRVGGDLQLLLDRPAGGAPTFPAKLDVEFPGRHQNRTVLQGVISVPVAEARRSQLGEHRSYNFVLTGEVLQNGSCSTASATSSTSRVERSRARPLPLVFQRYLRPGDYTADPQARGRQLRQVLPRGAAARRAAGRRAPCRRRRRPTPRRARILAEANAAISHAARPRSSIVRAARRACRPACCASTP